MHTSNQAPEPPPSINPAWARRLALTYAAFAALWILLSDKFVEWWLNAPSPVTLVGIVKGWLFVAFTSLLLYGLLRRRRLDHPRNAPATLSSWRTMLVTLALLVPLIIALTAATIAYTIQGQLQEQAVRMQAIADFKAQQVVDWLNERLQIARLLHTSGFIADAYRRWREMGDAASRDRLLSRLLNYRDLGSFQAVELLDEHAQPLWSSEDQAPRLDPAPLAAFLATTQTNAVRWVGPYRDAQGRIHLDFVAPLPMATGRPALVILHADDVHYLPRQLGEWPVPSTSGEVVLFRRDGADILFLNALKQAPNAAMKLRRPISDESLLAVQLIHEEGRRGHLLGGENSRGVPVFGVGRSIPGTHWYLLAELEQSELYAKTVTSTLSIILGGLLALLAAVAGLSWAQQRQQLAIAQGVQQAQAEQLRASRLLAAIADNSTDAIFAKDRQGCYILLNRQMEVLTGKSSQEALGQDDSLLFAPEQATLFIASDERIIETGQIETYEYHLTLADGLHHLLVTKGPLKDEAGQVSGVYGITRDITARVNQETALRESDERLRRVIEEAPFPMMIHAEDSEVLALNRMWTDLTGYALTDIPTLAGLGGQGLWPRQGGGAREQRCPLQPEAAHHRG